MLITFGKYLLYAKSLEIYKSGIITLQSAVRRPEIYRLFLNGTNPRTYHSKSEA